MGAVPRIIRPAAGQQRFAEQPLPWAIAAAVGAAAVGVVAHQNSTVLIDVVLAVVAIYAFVRFPFLMLLVILATGWKDNQAFELFSVVGGGTALTLRAPRTWRLPVTILLGALLLLALVRLPIGPTYADGAVPPHLWLPGTHVAYMGAVSPILISWWRLAFVLVSFGLAAWQIHDRQRLELAVGVTLGSSAIAIAIGLEQYASGSFVVRTGTTTQSIQGPFSFPNYFAFYLLTILLVAIVALVETRSRRARAALAMLVGAGAFCLFATYTRSAWIAFAAAIVVLGLLRYRAILTFGTVAVVAAAFAVPGVVHAIDKRFADLSSNSASNTNSYNWRTGEWRRMIPYGLHHPLDGTGFGTFPADTLTEFGLVSSTYVTLPDPSHPADSPKGFAAHNDYIRMLVELGFPGLVLWVLVLVCALGSAIAAVRVPALRSLAVAVGAVIAALMITSYSDNVQGYTAGLAYPFILAGGLAELARRSRAARDA